MATVSNGDIEIHYEDTGGSGRPGDRVQVWNGVVQTPWMNETFDLTLRVDPRELRMPAGSALSFESTFEIETLP